MTKKEREKALSKMTEIAKALSELSSAALAVASVFEIAAQIIEKAKLEILKKETEG
jgi:hypothetical protein